MFIEDLITFSLIFSEGIGEAYDGDIAFASALEAFGGGYNDPTFIVLEGIPLWDLFLHFYFVFVIIFSPMIHLPVGKNHGDSKITANQQKEQLSQG